MNIESLLENMYQAETYLELYDISENIMNNNLKESVITALSECESNNLSIDDAVIKLEKSFKNPRNRKSLTGIYTEEYSLFNKEENDKKSLSDYINEIKESSNDKDLLNVINCMEKNKKINENLVLNIHQLFKNNRYMSLQDKVDTILKYIDENCGEFDSMDIDSKQELTEAIDTNTQDNENTIDTDNVDNIDKENTSIENKINNDTTDANEILGALNKRVGQQFSVGDLNNLLQSIFGQYNKVFILSSDLTNKDLDKTQTITVDDDGITYNINYDIIDMDNGIVEIVSIDREEVGEE